MSHAQAKRHKERMTLSLSHEATSYAQRLRSNLKAPSMSALFEKLIGDLKRKTEIDRLNARASAYYDSLTDAQSAEVSGWAQLGQAGLESIEAELESDLANPEVAVPASR